MKPLIHFADPAPAPILDHPRPDRLIRGNPDRLTWERHTSNDGLCSAGEWQCEPGAWQIAFPTWKEEFFHVLEGRLRIADQDGLIREFGAGDAGVIPGGFQGNFEVVERVRKRYVIVERPIA